MQWPANAAEARIIQEELRARVHIQDDFGDIKTIAGVDVSYDIKSNLTRAFIVCMPLATLQPVQYVKAQLPTCFPYVPGLLSFRELPAILKAFEQLEEKPDMLMVDGQGIAHPRRLGIAAHLGILLDIPSIGVAKSRLVGTYEEPGLFKGDMTPLMHKEEKIGTVLRSKDNALPLFISPGHRVSHKSAVGITSSCLTRYRLPEPTRIADKLSKQKQASQFSGNLIGETSEEFA